MNAEKKFQIKLLNVNIAESPETKMSWRDSWSPWEIKFLGQLFLTSFGSAFSLGLLDSFSFLCLEPFNNSTEFSETLH